MGAHLMIYIMERICFNENFPERTPRGGDGNPIDPYHFQDVVVVAHRDPNDNFLDMHEVNVLTPHHTNWLKKAQDRGHLIVTGRSTNFPERVNIQGDVETYRGLHPTSREAVALKWAGVKLTEVDDNGKVKYHHS